MDETPGAENGGRSKRSRLKGAPLIAVVAAVVVGAGALYATQGAQHKGEAAPSAEKSEAAPPAQGPLARYATGSLAKLETPAEPFPAPATVFLDAEGKQTSLAAFKGKVAVVNVWATWCAPCVIEMPTLAALQRAYADTDLVVAPISVDRDAAKAKAFIDKQAPLPLYNDPKLSIPFALTKQGGLPQTALIDRQGRVRAWLLGENDWNNAETRRLIDALLAEPA